MFSLTLAYQLVMTFGALYSWYPPLQCHHLPFLGDVADETIGPPATWRKANELADEAAEPGARQQCTRYMIRLGRAACLRADNKARGWLRRLYGASLGYLLQDESHCGGIHLVDQD